MKHGICLVRVEASGLRPQATHYIGDHERSHDRIYFKEVTQSL